MERACSKCGGNGDFDMINGISKKTGRPYSAYKCPFCANLEFNNAPKQYSKPQNTQQNQAFSQAPAQTVKVEEKKDNRMEFMRMAVDIVCAKIHANQLGTQDVADEVSLIVASLISNIGGDK